MESRAFARTDFEAFVALIGANAKHRWPTPTGLMSSDVAWQFPGCGPKDNIRLWIDAVGIAGYAWFQPGANLHFDVRARLDGSADVVLVDGMFEEMSEWAVERSQHFGGGYPFHVDLNNMQEWADAITGGLPVRDPDQRYLTASAFESDLERIKALEAQGFARTQHFQPFLARSLESIDLPPTPAGLTLRAVREDELEARVAVHSASWVPATGFNLDRYQRVRAMDRIYDPELDVVAVTDDGTFASYTIAWCDPISGIGSFEPFGTRPEWRGTGASQAVIYEALRRMRDRGMHSAREYTAGFNHQAQSLYKGCEYQQVDVYRTFIRRC